MRKPGSEEKKIAQGKRQWVVDPRPLLERISELRLQFSWVESEGAVARLFCEGAVEHVLLGGWKVNDLRHGLKCLTGLMLDARFLACPFGGTKTQRFLLPELCGKILSESLFWVGRALRLVARVLARRWFGG